MVDGELHMVSADLRCKTDDHTDLAIATVVPYRAYKTKDTNIAVGGCNDRLYGILCDKLQRPEWKTDPRFLTNALRVKHRTEIDTLVEAELMTKTTQEWLEIFDGSGMPYAAVNDIKGTVEHEHVLARNMIEPLLGQHTDEVLRDMLGYGESEIKELRDKKVVA